MPKTGVKIEGVIHAKGHHSFPGLCRMVEACKPFESTKSAQKQIYQMSLNNEYLSAVCCKGLVRETAVNNKLWKINKCKGILEIKWDPIKLNKKAEYIHKIHNLGQHMSSKHMIIGKLKPRWICMKTTKNTEKHNIRLQWTKNSQIKQS